MQVSLWGASERSQWVAEQFASTQLKSFKFSSSSPRGLNSTASKCSNPTAAAGPNSRALKVSNRTAIAASEARIQLFERLEFNSPQRREFAALCSLLTHMARTNATLPAERNEIVCWARKRAWRLTGVVLDRGSSIFSSDSRRLAAENKAANNQRG